MADDLKLAVVIQALLDAKGFDQAQANINQLAGAANKAKVPLEDAGKSVKKLGEEFGGKRGAVADMTRVLLINIGATRGAGEAAKFAGIAVNALEGAAFGLSATMVGVTAGLSLLIPLLIEWMHSSDESAKRQGEIRDALVEQLDTFQSYVLQVPLATKAAKEFAAQLQLVALGKQAADTDKLRESLIELEHQSEKKYGGPGVFQTDEIIALKLQLKLAAEAEAQGLTPVQVMTKARTEATAAAKAQKEALEKLQAATLAGMQSDIDVLNIQADAENAFEDLRKQQDEDAKRDIEADVARTRKAAKEKIKAETEYVLAKRRLDEEEKRLEAEKAKEKQINQIQAIGYIGQTLTALSDLFGRNKSLAIAGALVDTYAGAALALKTIPPPAGWAAAAATIAQGLAHVQAIRKATPVGFDDPFSDLVARRLGRNSASDFVKYFGGEFLSGLKDFGAQAASHSTTINRGTTIDMRGMQVNGVMGNRTQFLKWFERTQAQAERQRKRTTVGR